MNDKEKLEVIAEWVEKMNNIKTEIGKSDEQIKYAKELVAKATKKRDDYIKDLRTLDSMISILSRRDPEPTPQTEAILDDEG